MATRVLMEALSPTMEEGRLVEWKKKEGDTVAVGEVLAEVETDKAVMDLLARAAGVILKHVVAPGTTVPVGSLVGVIGGAGEDISAVVEGATAAVAAVPASRAKASPLARKIAADRGVDLAMVRGSGPEGRIVAHDLEGVSATPAVRATAPAVVRAAAGEAYRDVPLTQLRKTIAKRLAQSIGPVPTFYLTTEVDMERVAEARQALAAADLKVSFNDIIVKAVALALRQHPACNAWWQEDRIRYWNEVHVSMAVAIEDGLITPVIRHADLKSLREIGAESRDLAARARDRRLTPEEYTGGTFSVSNLGMFDIDQFTAVINPPEAAILAVGSITPKPVAEGDRVVVRRRMRLTLSCDHRVIDGATGAAFLRTLKQMLENPLAMLA